MASDPSLIVLARQPSPALGSLDTHERLLRFSIGLTQRVEAAFRGDYLAYLYWTADIDKALDAPSRLS